MTSNDLTPERAMKNQDLTASLKLLSSDGLVTSAGGGSLPVGAHTSAGEPLHQGMR